MIKVVPADSTTSGHDFSYDVFVQEFQIFFISIFQNVAPIGDDDDGHLAYKLGDVIEHETQKCNENIQFSPL